MNTAPTPTTTTAFYAQSVVAFGLALTAITFGIWYLPVDAWIRAFLIVTALFLVTSTFTLAKCVRDAQESSAVTARIDQARMEKMLAEHDPFAPSVDPLSQR